MNLKLLKCLIVLITLLFFLSANANSKFIQGKDYYVVSLPSSKQLQSNSNSKQQRPMRRNTHSTGIYLGKELGHHPKNEVIEFFSYGCPACFSLEENLISGLYTQKKKIQFKRIPVAFNPEWLPLAKAYYIAKAYGKEKIVSKALFAAIHQHQQNLANLEEIEKIFKMHKIPKEEFLKMYYYSVEIEDQIKQDEKLRDYFKIEEIPAFVIAGKYVTDLGKVNGDWKKMRALIQYLLHKKR